MTKILIAGATGTTGADLVGRFSEQQQPVRAMSRNLQTAPKLPAVEWVQADFADKQSLQNAMQGVERLYLAMPPHPDHLSWIKNLVNAASACGVSQLVKLSALGASTHAGCEIIRNHGESDQLIAGSGLDYAILQANSFFQNILGALPSIQSQHKIYMSLAASKISFVDARDVAAAAYQVLHLPVEAAKVHLLTGPEALSYADLAASISQVSAEPVYYEAIDHDQLLEGMRAAGLSPWLSQQLADLAAWLAQGGYDVVTGDIDELLERPATSFDQFVSDNRLLFSASG